MEEKQKQNIDSSDKRLKEELKQKEVSKLSIKNDKKPFIAGNLLKIIVFLVLSVSFVFANFVLEQYMADSVEGEKMVFNSFDYSKDNILPEMGVFRFSDDALLDRKSCYGFADE